MDLGIRRHAITAVGPYVASALAVGTSMLTHATPLQTGVLLVQGAAISLLCGAVRASRERTREHALRELDARRAAEEARGSAEEARLRCQGVFDSAVDLMVLIDNDLAIVDANRAAADFLGRRRDELVGAHSSGFLAPQDRVEWVHRWQAAKTEPASQEVNSILRSGNAAKIRSR